MRASTLIPVSLLLIVGCTPRSYPGGTRVRTTVPASPAAAPDLPSPTPPPPPSPSPSTPLLTSLAIDVPAQLHIGTPATLRALAVDADHGTHDITGDVAWSSSDDTILHLAGGHMTGVAAGTAQLRATLGDLMQTMTITVDPAQLVRVDVRPGAQSVPLGAVAQLLAIGSYDDGGTQDLTAQATWSTDDASIAVADATTPGAIDTLAVGHTTARASVGELTGSAELTVGVAGLASLLVVAGVPRPYDMPQQLVAIGTYTDGSTADLTASANWRSMNPHLARMDPNVPGLISAVSSGVVTVKAGVGDINGTVDVIFVPKLLGIGTDNVAAPLAIGSCRAIHTFFEYDDGSVQSADDSATWDTSDPSRVTVSNDPASVGLACAVASGSVTLTVSAGPYTTTTTIVVP
jgi:hypothetical protein